MKNEPYRSLHNEKSLIFLLVLLMNDLARCWIVHSFSFVLYALSLHLVDTGIQFEFLSQHVLHFRSLEHTEPCWHFLEWIMALHNHTYRKKRIYVYAFPCSCISFNSGCTSIENFSSMNLHRNEQSLQSNITEIRACKTWSYRIDFRIKTLEVLPNGFCVSTKRRRKKPRCKFPASRYHRFKIGFESDTIEIEEICRHSL